MADSTDVSSSSNRKRVRGPTMLKEIQKVRRTGVKMQVEFDPETMDCIGENACIFHSYVALVARERCSILKDEWNDISDEVKKDIWKDVEDHFDIPKYDDKEKNNLKKVWINYAGERWRDFKARLTGNYITRPKPGAVPPYVKYDYIKKDIWEAFVKSRQTPEFQAKSQRGKDNMAKNVYLHGLSRGGYRKLEETMMNEKRLLKSKDDSTLTDDDTPPSPPDRHEKWTRARTKKGGGYTSEAVKKVAEKIDYLVEETKKGSFLPDGRNDILTEAIGTSEHGGRVRGVGKKHNISTYFERSKVLRQRENIDVKEQLEEFKADLEAKFDKKLAEEHKKLAEERKMMHDSLMETLKSMGLSQNLETNNKVIEPEAQNDKLVVTGSAKGSCSAAPVPEGENDNDAVEKLLMMFLKNGEDHLQLPLSYCSGLDNFWMSSSCMRELLVGCNWLDMSVLQVWCEYIHHLCIENNISEVYGCLDPVVCNIAVTGKTNNQKVSQARCKQYIQNKLQNEKKEFLLIPFNHGGHWQLIILCLNTNIVVVLCSLHRDLIPTMKNIVQSAFTVYQMANGNRKNNTQWLFPKTRKQPNSNDCGYYVMKNLLDIVSAKITGSWMEVFNDPKELSNDELYELRRLWATLFLKLYKG